MICLILFEVTLQLIHSIFRNIFADAFDSDFSNGRILNTKFKFIGNDAIDTSGSTVEMRNIICDNVQDKAISAGEKSTLSLDNIIVTDTQLL